MRTKVKNRSEQRHAKIVLLDSRVLVVVDVKIASAS